MEQRPFFIVEETAAKRETWEGSKQKCRRKILRESRRVGGEGKEKEETAAKTKDTGW